MSTFRPVDRDTGFLLPPSVDEWLPERHLARFVAEVIEGLDLRAMIGSYRCGGEAAYHPRLPYQMRGSSPRMTRGEGGRGGHPSPRAMPPAPPAAPRIAR